jgi:CBS domain-containing protein
MKDVLIKDIISSAVYTVTEYEPLRYVRNILDEHNVHHVPVMSESKIVYIISSVDVERSKYGSSFFVNHNTEAQNETLLAVILAGSIMTVVVETISHEDTLYNAYLIFKRNSFRALPVTDGEKLVGIVIPMDFLDYFSNKK